MKFHIALTGVFLALAACGGSGQNALGPGGGAGGGGTGGGGGGAGEPDPGELPIDVTNDQCPGAFVCSGDLSAVAYDYDAQTLTITGLPFDDNPLGAVYIYQGEVNGFQLYENTDPSTFNRYLAVAGETTGGEITLGHTAIEGYQNFGYSGSWLQTDSVTNTLPSSGLVAYNGTYAGLMTFDGSGALEQTTGDVFMEVDFTDSKLKGFVVNRVIVGGDSLLNIVMNDTDITDGSFSGTTVSYDGPDQKGSGTYQGYFGGSGAPVIGGILSIINPEFGGDDTDSAEDNITSRDTGIFIADVTP